MLVKVLCILVDMGEGLGGAERAGTGLAEPVALAEVRADVLAGLLCLGAAVAGGGLASAAVVDGGAGGVSR